MRTLTERDRAFVRALFNDGIIRVAEDLDDLSTWFDYSSGVEKPLYVELRDLCSFPVHLVTVASMFCDLFEELKPDFDHLAAVPLGAMQLATAVQVHARSRTQSRLISGLLLRGAAKQHGSKSQVHGQFTKGQRALVLEDVVFSGASLIHSVNDLRAAGLVVNQAVAVLSHEQLGVDSAFKAAGLGLHPLFTIDQLMEVLLDAELITRRVVRLMRR